MTLAEFKSAIGAGEVYVKFYTSFCSSCKIVTSILKALNLETLEVNLEESKEVQDEYQIRSLPTIIKFKDGRETDRLSGAITKDRIQEFYGTNSI